MFGMTGTGRFSTDERPTGFLEGILLTKPNGSAPLTAILSKGGGQITLNDPSYTWFEKITPTQCGAVTGVYNDSALASAYSSGAAAGTVLYFKMAAATVAHFKPGHIVRVGTLGYPQGIHTGEVVSVLSNGASSYIALRMTKVSATYESQTVATVNYATIIGSAYEEGADRPVSVSYDPTPYKNLTQIFRTSVEITRTAKKTKLRTGDALKEMKREALELHSIEIEKALLFGNLLETTGAKKGQPKRLMGGIEEFIMTYAPTNCDDWRYNSSFTNTKFLDGGEEWFNNYLEKVFQYGEAEKIAYCGSTVLRALNDLAKAGGQFTLTAATVAYGIKVVEWLTPYGVVYLKTHPLLSTNSQYNRRMFIIEPANVKLATLEKTHFIQGAVDGAGTETGTDGESNEWLSELTAVVHNFNGMAVLDGFGADNGTPS